MFPFRINSVVSFRDSRLSRYVQSYHAITFQIRGLRFLKLDGATLDGDLPCILLTPKGTRIETLNLPNRETWGIVVHTECWRQSAQVGCLDICLCGRWMALPMLTLIDPAHVPQWQRELGLFRRLFLDPIPTNLLRLQLGVLQILRFVLEQDVSDPHPRAPEQQLKQMLETPETRQLPLAELFCRTGYSAEHLRARFRKQFGISPVAYRTQCQLAEAMDLISNTRLTVKEIAFRVGCRQVSHFSRIFKQHFGLSPSDAVARYRCA